MIRFLLFLLQSLAVLYPINVLSDAQAEFMHCSDFGCKTTQPISFNQSQWQQINELFARPALSSWLEKQQIRQAIALMEQFAGALTGTHLDKGENYSGQDLPHQQDCIDESTNTLQYLHALQNRDLLRWHQVEGKQRRIVWLFTHWTARIRDLSNNRLYAVDSWYLDNGLPPYIQSIEDWQSRESFSLALNP